MWRENFISAFVVSVKFSSLFLPVTVGVCGFVGRCTVLVRCDLCVEIIAVSGSVLVLSTSQFHCWIMKCLIISCVSSVLHSS